MVHRTRTKEKKRWQLLGIFQNALRAVEHMSKRGAARFFLLQCCDGKMTYLSISLDDTGKTRTSETSKKNTPTKNKNAQTKTWLSLKRWHGETIPALSECVKAPALRPSLHTNRSALSFPRQERNAHCYVVFFFEQCCARHYNCGSHEAVLK